MKVGDVALFPLVVDSTDYGIRASSTGIATVNCRIVPIDTPGSLPWKEYKAPLSLSFVDMLDGQERWRITPSSRALLSLGGSTEEVEIEQIAGMFEVLYYASTPYNGPSGRKVRYPKIAPPDKATHTAVFCHNCQWTGKIRAKSQARHMVWDVTNNHPGTCYSDGSD